MTANNSFDDGRAFLWLGLLGAALALTTMTALRMELQEPGIQVLNPASVQPLSFGHGVLFLHFCLAPILFHGFGRFLTGADLPPPLRWLGPLSFVALASALPLFVVAVLVALARASAGSGGGPLELIQDLSAFSVALALWAALLALALTAADLLSRLFAAFSEGGAARGFALSAGGAGFGVAALLATPAIWLETQAILQQLFPGVDGPAPSSWAIRLGATPTGFVVIAAAWGAADAASRWGREAPPAARIGAGAMLLYGLGAAGAMLEIERLAPLIAAPLLLPVLWLAEAACARRFSLATGWGLLMAASTLVGLWHMAGLGAQGLDLVLHDTYYEIAAGHYWLGLAGIFAAFAAWAACGPALSGRRPAPFWAGAHFAAAALGAGLSIAPMSQLGLAGMPRRYIDYPEAFSTLQLVASLGAYLFAASFLLFLLGLVFARPAEASLGADGRIS